MIDNSLGQVAGRFTLILAMVAGLLMSQYGDSYIAGIGLSIVSITITFIYCMQYRKRNKLSYGRRLQTAVALASIILILFIVSPFIFSDDLSGLSDLVIVTMFLVVILAFVLSLELLSMKPVKIKRK